MENNVTANGQLSLANEGAEDAIKIQDEASINELSPLLSRSDSTTTLIPISPTIPPTDNDADPEAQLPSTPPSESDEEPSPPLTWPETGYVAFTFVSYVGSSVVSFNAETFFDVLYFTKLAGYMVCMCLLMNVIFIATFELSAQRRIDASKRSGKIICLLFFKFTLFCWGAWFAFYGIIWFWAVLKQPGSRQSVWQMSRVWREFQGKMEVQDALTMLTSCLKKVEGNATVSDFGVCLREMGVKDS